jgi:hypothetical protein
VLELAPVGDPKLFISILMAEGMDCGPPAEDWVAWMLEVVLVVEYISLAACCSFQPSNLRYIG